MSDCCVVCGDDLPPLPVYDSMSDGHLCDACDQEDALDQHDSCKLGGPAPCIDDVCHAIGGCMHHAEYQA